MKMCAPIQVSMCARVSVCTACVVFFFLSHFCLRVTGYTFCELPFDPSGGQGSSGTVVKKIEPLEIFRSSSTL